MISPKFYSQITVCPACSGWGDTCKECLGQGVSVVQSENIYIWDAPTYIDYGARTRVLIFKILAVVSVIFIVLMLIMFIRFVLLKSLGI